MAPKANPKGFDPKVEDRSLTNPNNLCDDNSKNVGDNILPQETKINSYEPSEQSEPSSFLKELDNAFTFLRNMGDTDSPAVSNDGIIEPAENSESNYGFETICVVGAVILVIAAINYYQKKNKKNDD